MSISDLRLTIYSTALYSTWVFADQWKLLLDCGDGAAAGLLQKSRKIRTVAVTHPDRDHLHGLPQLLQLNSRDGLPRVLYPRDSGSFPRLAAFLSAFDPGTSSKASWQPVMPGDSVSLGKELRLRVLPSRHLHLQPPEVIKAVSYAVERVRSGLRPELRGLSQAELDRMREEQGPDALSVERTERLLVYTGDTPVAESEAWGRPRILVHESTFLTSEEATNPAALARYNLHSGLPDVLDLAAAIAPEALVLIHFSARYSRDDIRAAAHREAAARRLPFPIWAVLPGDVVNDVFRTPALWTGT